MTSSRRLLVAAGTLVALLALAGAGIAYFANRVVDPADASCGHPSSILGTERNAGDHQEREVHFRCEGASLGGTIYLPTSSGRHAAAVWVHGAGEAMRLTWGGQLLPGLVSAGVVVLSYDKRGVGESEGDCCTSPGRYNLVAADADGAVLALRSRDDIDASRVGFYGVSEAGWVVPLANSRLKEPVAFTALVSGPTVTTGEEEVWSNATGEDEPEPLTTEKKAEATRRLEAAGPSGFDPAPYIEQMQTPGLWLFGGGDKSIPTDRSVAILKRLKAQGKDFTIVVFPAAGHGLVDNVPTAPEAPNALVSWIKQTEKVLKAG